MLLRLLKYLAITIGILLAAIAGLIGFTYAFPPTYEASIELSGTKSRITIELEPMHLYLAEYQRTLVLRSPGKTDIRVKIFPDTGGYSRAQLYRLADGRFLLHGYFDAYVIDPQKHAISEDGKNIPNGSYLGAFDDRGREWGFNEAVLSPEQPLKVEIN